MNLLDITLILVLIAGFALLVYGYWKKSQGYMLLGGMAFFAPIFYFIGWLYAMPFAAPIALVISYIAKKKENPA